MSNPPSSKPFPGSAMTPMRLHIGLFQTPPGKTRTAAISTASGIMRALLTLLTALGLVAGVSAIPAAAAPPSMTYYGLGDSIAAGTGAVMPTPAVPCLQNTTFAYPNQLGAAQNLGCYGATTTDVQNQANSLPSNVRNVTITVGANDVDAGNVAVTCVTLPAQCQQAIAYSTLVLLPQLPAKLTATISLIHAKAPAAHITFTGYPLLFTVPGLPSADQPVASEINAATTALNQTIALTALTRAARYVDVTLPFYNHGIGSPAPWINPLTLSATTTWDPGSFHPNAAGYTLGYVPAVARFLN